MDSHCTEYTGSLCLATKLCVQNVEQTGSKMVHSKRKSCMDLSCYKDVAFSLHKTPLQWKDHISSTGNLVPNRRQAISDNHDDVSVTMTSIYAETVLITNVTLTNQIGNMPSVTTLLN